MKFYITTANQCLNLTKTFAYLFNKFVNPEQEVTIVGYDAPTFKLPDNFKFVSMGTQKGGVELWATDLIKFFNSIDDEFFTWATEDQFIISKINYDLFNKLILLLDDDVGRVGLTNDMKRKVHGGKQYKNNVGVHVSAANQERISATWSIWNREYLLKYLKPGQTPWSFETQKAPNNDGYIVLGTRPAIVVRPCVAISK